MESDVQLSTISCGVSIGKTKPNTPCREGDGGRRQGRRRGGGSDKINRNVCCRGEIIINHGGGGDNYKQMNV